LAITKPFTRTFLFHDGILAIKEPFIWTFFWLWNSGYQGSFSRTFSFTRWNSQNARFGGRLFSYISQRVFT
jgi:hypothetical protein